MAASAADPDIKTLYISSENVDYYQSSSRVTINLQNSIVPDEGFIMMYALKSIGFNSTVMNISEAQRNNRLIFRLRYDMSQVLWYPRRKPVVDLSGKIVGYALEMEDKAEWSDGDNRREGNEAQEDEEKGETISVEEEEGAMVRVAKAERTPSKEEVTMHMVNHIPFRSWCVHCVKGKAHGNPHRRRKAIGDEQKEPVVSIGYMFTHDNQGEGEERGMPIIRAKLVPQKGSHWYGIKVLSGTVECLGHKR